MIYYITGGQRSGKSSYAQQLALQLSEKPVYLATARQWDGDFQNRIARHKADRDNRWESIEEEKQLSRHDFTGRVVVLDCITLWLNNFFIDSKSDVDISLSQAKEEFDKLTQQNATFIVVSNELGMGMHAHSEIGRKFTDLQGWMNQHIAQKADKAILMISGLPMTIQGQ